MGTDTAPSVPQRDRYAPRADPLRDSASGGDGHVPTALVLPRLDGGSLVLPAFIARQHERASSGEGYSFAVADATTDVCWGQIGLWPLGDGRASIGYWVVASARRRGVARRALQIVSAWALALPGIDRLELYVEPWNEGSWRAAERSDYTREGLVRSWQTVGDQRRDMYMYSRLRAKPPTCNR